jgi:cellobiose transport system substrate-binding protein
VARNSNFVKAVTVVSSLALTLGIVSPVQAADKTVVNIWSFGDVIRPEFATAYEKLNPDIDLVIKKSDLDPHHNSLTTAMLAKNTPDIAAIEVSYSGYFRSYPKYFLDLKTVGASEMESDFLDWRWDQGVGDDGRVIGIPTDVGGAAIAYRTDLFKAAGLPTDPVKVSALWPTWDKFMETGKNYKAKTKKSFIDSSGTIYAAVLNQGQEKYYDRTGKLVYSTNKQVRTAFDTSAKALAAGIGSNISQFTSDWNPGLNKGSFATVIAPAWMLAYIKNLAPSTKGKWNVADLPGGGGNIGGSQLSIPASAKHPKEAMAFIKWYLSPEMQLKVFKDYGLFPSAKVLYDDATVLGYKDPFFNNAPIGSIYAKGALALKPIFEGRKQRQIDNIFGQALSRVALKKQTAAAAWQQALNEIKKTVG